MLKKLLIIIALLMLTACGSTGKAITDVFRPMPWLLEHYPENAPEPYKQGWQHGCESGMAAMTNDYYRTFYRFKNDPEQVRNPVYYKPWKDAYNYCRHYVYAPLRESQLRNVLPNVGTQDMYHAKIPGLTNALQYHSLFGGHGAQKW